MANFISLFYYILVAQNYIYEKKIQMKLRRDQST